MHRSLFLTTIALIGSIAGALPASAASVDADANLQKALVGLTKVAGAPGGVMLVANGSSVWRGATGVAIRKPRQRMRVDRRFRIASVTKMFVATVTLQLVRDGKLSLSDSVERWLPGAVPDGSRITIRHLLSHTSGLTENSGEAPSAIGEFRYANRNYHLIGEIIEAATGSKVADEVEARILRPLDLGDTVWTTTPALLPRLAHGYTVVIGHDATVSLWEDLGAAGALVSSAGDLEAFLDGLFGGKLIPDSLLAEMQVAVDVGAFYRPIYDGYGLGLMKLESRCGTAWGHRGRTSGYTSYAFATAHGQHRIVVLLNVGEVGDTTVSRLNKLVLTALCR